MEAPLPVLPLLVSTCAHSRDCPQSSDSYPYCTARTCRRAGLHLPAAHPMLRDCFLEFPLMPSDPATMAEPQPLAGKKVLIMGLGRFGGGVGVAKWLVS